MLAKLGIWLPPLILADRLSGIEKVGVEFQKVVSMSKLSGQRILGVAQTGFEIPYGFPRFEEIRRSQLIKSKVNTVWEVDVLWISGLNPMGFLEIIEARKKGLKVVSSIYDLFPLQYPELFPREFLKSFKVWLLLTLRVSDVLVFTSQDQINFFYSLGFDFSGSTKLVSLGASVEGPIFPSKDRNPYGILAVSTIEPRKCYGEILDSFETLAALGYPVTLTIVGQYGWEEERVKKRILNHKEFNKSLFWEEHCSDQNLTELYRKNSISVLASKNEGWGFALEEGLRHGHKVVARDIPIFRARENENIKYFDHFDHSLTDQLIEVFETDFVPINDLRTLFHFGEELISIMDELALGVGPTHVDLNGNQN
jgi:glycosyltransferase involved in cell wall biosynthesis